MRWVDRLAVRFRSLARRSRVEQELDAELQFHFDQQVEENLAAGMSEADARVAAVDASGGRARVREDCRDALGLRLLDELRQDLHYAARAVIKSPAFSLVAVLTLALGIGANTALFSVVYGVLVRPLPYRDAGRLVQFRTERDFTGRPQPVQTNFSLVDLEQWRQLSPSLESVALVAGSRGAVSGPAGSEGVNVATVTDSFFSTVGGQMLLGRPLTAIDDDAPVVVISQGLWRRQFADSPSAVGRQLFLDSQPYTIVGVVGSTFQLPTASNDVWRTAGFTRTLIPAMARRGQGGFTPIARLKPGATMEQAGADAEAVLRAIVTIDARREGTRVTAMNLREQMVAGVKPAILVLFAAVGLVLFVACANVTNLLLARDASRSREQAIRLALGASRGRLARQSLVYSAVLSSCGALVGIAAAAAIVAVLKSLAPVGIPRLDTVQVNLPVLLFALIATVVTTLIIGILPAFQSTDAAAVIKSGGCGTSVTHRSRRLRQMLIVAELAVSVILLVGASLLARSLVRLMAIDIGVSADHVTAAQIEVFHGRTSSFLERKALIERVVERVRSMPGVTAAGAGVALPPNRAMLRITMDRVDEAIGRPTNYLVDAVTATPEYFSTMGVRLQRGRFFTSADDEDHPQVMLMGAVTARQMFGAVDPIGRSVAIPILKFDPDAPAGNAPVTVVGVVDDVKYSGFEAPADGVIYRPFAQQPSPIMFIVARTADDVAGMGSALRREIARVDPSIVVYAVTSVDGLVAAAVAPPRFRTVVLGGLSGLALVLAAIGLYGVVAYSVVQRTAEIGIRMALGAAAADVVRMVLREGMLLAFLGVAIGLVSARALTGILRSLLYGIQPGDPLSFVGAAATLLLVTFLASYIPARRATRVDPLVALRCE